MKYTDRTIPMDKHMGLMIELRGFETGPPAAQIFGNAGREHMERYGTTAEHFAKIAYKNHEHSTRNPNSQFQDEYTLEQIMSRADGARPAYQAAVLPDVRWCRGRHPLQRGSREAAWPRGAGGRDRGHGDDHRLRQSTFDERSAIKLIGSDMTRKAAESVYEQSGLGPEDVDVIELHDCFSANELVTYEGLGLCPEGKAGTLIDDGAVTYGGQWVVNPSGGLISKGHPLGATGLAQCSELSWQLRGLAGPRQVEGASVALQHNLGLGGAAVVTMYRAPAAAK